MKTIKNNLPDISAIASDNRFFRSLHYIYFFGMFVHAVFLLYFYQLGVMPMAIFNVFSVPFYLVLFLLNRKEFYFLAFIMAVVEVILHSALATYYIGWATGFHLYIPLVFFSAFFIPNKNLIFKLSFTLTLLFFYLAMYIFSLYNTPPYLPEQKTAVLLNGINITITGIIMLAFAFVYSWFVALFEKKLLENEKELTKLNTSKDRFFSIFSHDLKNPMNIALGFSELLSVNYHKLEEASKQKYIQNIYEAQQDMSKLMENLLEWSRSQMGKTPFHPVILSTTSLIDKVFADFQRPALTKSISMFKDVEEETLFADEHMINTVLRNLIGNAIKFTPRYGRIDIVAKKKQEFIQIEVMDTGIGISNDLRERLFLLDGKTQRPGTEKEKGTGLGLFICKELMAKNNGAIRAESREPQGSNFILTLPKHP